MSKDKEVCAVCRKAVGEFGSEIWTYAGSAGELSGLTVRYPNKPNYEIEFDDMEFCSSGCVVAYLDSIKKKILEEVTGE